MLTREDDVDAHALRRQGWTISAIARHLGHDRKTIRAYLTGGRVAGQRASIAEDPLAPFVGYLGSGWPTTRTCGRRRCSTRSSRSASTGPIRRSPAACARTGCGRTASRAALATAATTR